jgi:hypothetical protein
MPIPTIMYEAMHMGMTMFSSFEILCYMHHFEKQNMPLIVSTCVHFLVCQVMPIKLTTH